MTLDYKAVYIISAQYIKACRKKVRKTNILSPKRGITHSKIDVTLDYKAVYIISAQYIKAYM